MTPFITSVVLISLFDFVGILCAKWWSVYKNPLFLIATIVLFGGAGFFFARSLRFEGMGVVNILWSALSAILVTATGYFIFKESLTVVQMLGMVAIIIGLVLVNVK